MLKWVGIHLDPVCKHNQDNDHLGHTFLDNTYRSIVLPSLLFWPEKDRNEEYDILL
jgi:hypothetical protein